mgnify:CR=1 FL=1
MKENHYDNETFFEAYSRFPRSVEGLRAAGEWHELKKLLPDFTDKRVLDLGCGFGWHCRYAAEQGARSVLGTDLSEKMLERAREMTQDPRITYRRAAMEDLEGEAGSFDVALSSLALHYVDDLRPVFQKIHDLLVPGGVFVFSCEHPIFTAEGSQDWYCDGNGRPLHWPVDRYFTEGKRTAHFLGCEVVKYHHTLTDWLNTLLETGFALERVVEPRPDPALMDVPGMADELRRPMMLLVRGRRI